MDLVLIPAGEFTMGSSTDEAERRDDEGPQHRVRITRPFYLGAYEVTQAQYEKVMGKNPSAFKGPTRPVESVRWNDAVEFCRRLSREEGRTYRLPTEAEWEYACRARSTTPFTYGKALSTRTDANFNADYSYNGSETGPYREETVPVGSFRPNAWGLYDMHGNVWEWCQDWFASDYYQKSPANDPPGPTSGTYRVDRGGAWSVDAAGSRSASRDGCSPNMSDYSRGFRVVLVPAGTGR
jgi:formylglycine-generating enzyme required for sulfatase activity